MSMGIMHLVFIQISVLPKINSLAGLQAGQAGANLQTNSYIQRSTRQLADSMMGQFATLVPLQSLQSFVIPFFSFRQYEQNPYSVILILTWSDFSALQIPKWYLFPADVM